MHNITKKFLGEYLEDCCNQSRLNIGIKILRRNLEGDLLGLRLVVDENGDIVLLVVVIEELLLHLWLVCQTFVSPCPNREEENIQNTFSNSHNLF